MGWVSDRVGIFHLGSDRVQVGLVIRANPPFGSSLTGYLHSPKKLFHSTKLWKLEAVEVEKIFLFLILGLDPMTYKIQINLELVTIFNLSYFWRRYPDYEDDLPGLLRSYPALS